MTIADYISSGAVKPYSGGVIDNSIDTSAPFLALNPKLLNIELCAGIKARLIIVCTESSTASVEITLNEGAQLDVVELYLADSHVAVTAHQHQDSSLNVFSALLSSSNVGYTHLLEGQRANNTLNALYIATGSDHATINLNTRHMVADCTSRSLIKGIAAHKATGEFRGLVYVAPDAQRTDAQQQSRNIELDNAHIVSLPQLEIYADDVRCSHGSTVGYEDKDALFYMRQRGIDEVTARRLQIEGFIQDVVMHCSLEPLCSLVRDAVNDKLTEI